MTDADTARGLPFWAAPASAWTLAGLTVLLAAALVPLSLAARQDPLATEGANVVAVLSFAVVGLVVAWYRPWNPIGWLMLAVAVGLVFYVDGGLYNVLNYRLGHRLPLAPVVLLLYHASTPVLAVIPLMILLFPDGRLPSPRWRWAVGGYLTLAAADMIVQAQMVAYALTHHRTQVDTIGVLLLSNRQYAVVFAPLGLIFFACWFVAVGYQVVSWRRAAGERRQQLSWLMAGGAVALVSFIAVAFAHAAHGSWQVVSDVLYIGVAALPVGMGVAILKYRLYEIDRIVSRTLAYTIVTGLLVGGVRGAGLAGHAGAVGELAAGGGRGHAGRSGLVHPGAAPGAAGGGPPVQPGPVRRGPHGRGVRSPTEGCGGPGDDPYGPGRRREPGPGARPRLGVDKPTRVNARLAVWFSSSFALAILCARTHGDGARGSSSQAALDGDRAWVRAGEGSAERA